MFFLTVISNPFFMKYNCFPIPSNVYKTANFTYMIGKERVVFFKVMRNNFKSPSSSNM